MSSKKYSFSFLLFVVFVIVIPILFEPYNENRLLFIIKHLSSTLIVDKHYKPTVLRELVSKFIENF